MNFDRLYTLWQAVTARPRYCRWLEVGSYKGGSSKFIAETLKQPAARRASTCATHSRGTPGWIRRSTACTSDEGFKDTSAEAVAEYLAGYPNVELVVGDIFETSTRLTSEPAFGFVHIDVDVYPATDFCLRVFLIAPRAWRRDDRGRLRRGHLPGGAEGGGRFHPRQPGVPQGSTC